MFRWFGRGVIRVMKIGGEPVRITAWAVGCARLACTAPHASKNRTGTDRICSPVILVLRYALPRIDAQCQSFLFAGKPAFMRQYLPVGVTRRKSSCPSACLSPASAPLCLTCQMRVSVGAIPPPFVSMLFSGFKNTNKNTNQFVGISWCGPKSLETAKNPQGL